MKNISTEEGSRKNGREIVKNGGGGGRVRMIKKTMMVE